MNATPRRVGRFASVLGAALLLAACAGMHQHQGELGPRASAQLAPTTGHAAQGRVLFQQHGEHVMVLVRLSGLQPNAVHGFHVHEKGDCSSGDGSSTGGHFNPSGQPHGPQGGAHHAGDMPALTADANGMVDTRFHLVGVTVAPGPFSLVGRGLIVHVGPDDYRTQPTGNSGARMACAVINPG